MLKCSLNYGEQEVEIVNQYKYLGIIFKQNGLFNNAIHSLSMQARKATLSLYSKINRLDLPIDCQLQLFQQTIVPIALYGCEIWGSHNLAEVEKVQTEFLRNVLRVRKSTPLFMLYGETGMEPLSVSVKMRVINFWGRLITGKTSKLSYIVYNFLFNDLASNTGNKWIKLVKSIFDELGMSNIWETQTVPSFLWLKNTCKLRLNDQYKQTWSESLNASSKGLLYRIFKIDFCCENYLLNLSDHYRKIFTKFRTSNHKLPIETGRWTNTPRQERVCNICDLEEVGDEFHYIFNCKFFKKERESLLGQYYCTRGNTIKFEELFNTTSEVKLAKICKFLKLLLNKFP